MSNNELKKTSEYDCIRAIPRTGPDWDGAVCKDDISYPIGRTIIYPPPCFITPGGNETISADQLKSHISARSKRSSSRSTSRSRSRSRSKAKKKVKDMGDFEIIESESEDEDENEKEEKEVKDTILKPAFALEKNKIPSVPRSAFKKKKNELIVFNEDDEVYPIFPNEVTAATKEELQRVKWDPSNLNFFSQNSEYIIYDQALVRVRYIVQLSSKSKKIIREEGNQNYRKVRKTRRAQNHFPRKKVSKRKMSKRRMALTQF